MRLGLRGSSFVFFRHVFFFTKLGLDGVNFLRRKGAHARKAWRLRATAALILLHLLYLSLLVERTLRTVDGFFSSACSACLLACLLCLIRLDVDRRGEKRIGIASA